MILLTKQEYMQRLYKALKPLSKENRNKIMNDYELQFSQEMKNGKTEQDIIYDLGSPEDAAEYFINIYQSDRGYHDHYNIEQASNKNSSTAHSWEAAIWGTLSIIIIPTMIAIMLAFFALGIAFCIAGMVMVFSSFILNSLSIGFFFIAVAGVFLAVFGIFIAILSIYDGITLIGKYFRLIRNRIKYGGKAK